ncbi:uncharacterized protein [Solanum lycopersicum]|uniref:uncharacterized protein n=1 Tax=Solanum lycopersicum TaxID=4081 RepID=UPI0037498979
MASVDPTITQIVATTPTSQTVWELLHMAYANKSHTRFFSLILSGLGPEFLEISASIRARDSSLCFEELFHKLKDHELFLKHQDLENSSSNITAAVAQRTTMTSRSNRNNRRFKNKKWNQSLDSQTSTINNGTNLLFNFPTSTISKI